MDINMLLSGLDISDIKNQVKEIIKMVKTENELVKLIDNEDNIYILLDIKSDDIIAYRITTGVIKIQEKNFIEIKRTLGKWNLSDLKNLIGDGAAPIESTLKRLMPIINGFNSLIKLNKTDNEKRVSIQLDIKDNDVVAYQVVLSVFEVETKNKLVVNRILDKYNLNEFLKNK